jgi:hypothetical protein
MQSKTFFSVIGNNIIARSFGCTNMKKASLYIALLLWNSACELPGIKNNPPNSPGSGQSGGSLRIYQFDGSVSTSSSEWFLSGSRRAFLLNFDKTKFPHADSIIFVPVIRTSFYTNTCYAELYNVTDSISISGSMVESTYPGWYEIRSGNIFQGLPDKPVTLAVRIRSETDGVFVSTGDINCLYVYNR